MRTFILDASAALTLLLVACDPTSAVEPNSFDPDRPAPVAGGGVASAPEPVLAAPLVASVELPGDVMVDYYDLFGGTVGVLVKGPASANLDGQLAQVHASVEDAATGTEAAFTLEGLRDEPMQQPAHPHVNGLRDDLRPSAVFCGGINATGQGTLHRNAGDCTQFHTNTGEETLWQYSDTIAFAGHVSSIDGDFIWDIRMQNWGVGSWFWALESEPIAGGEQAYFFTADKNNDFNITSRVEALDNSSDHYHDVGRCHDWNGRMQFGNNQAGGCSLWTGVVTPVKRFCAVASDYEGLELTNIPTNGDWDGNGNIWSC